MNDHIFMVIKVIKSFLYSSSMYSYHLFLISSASVISLPFLSFIEPIFAWNVPLVSLIFLKTSLAFPILLFSSISLHWWLRKAFLSLLAPKDLAYLTVGVGLQYRTAGSGRYSFCSIEAEFFSSEKLQLLPLRPFNSIDEVCPENQLIIDTNHNNKIPSQQHPN